MGNLIKIRLLDELHLTLQWIYEWNIPPERLIRQAKFPTTVIWIVLDGQKRVTIGGNEYLVRKGDVVIIPPSVPRSGTAEQADFGYFHYITLASNIRVGSLDFVKIYQLPILSHLAGSDRWDELTHMTRELLGHADRMLEGLNLDSRWTNIITEEARELNTMQSLELIDLQRSFYQWFGFLCKTIKPGIPDEPMHTDNRIQDICSYIKLNISSTLSPSDLAAVGYLSKSHVRLLFRKTFGISPMEYVRRARMKYARELLLNSDYRLADIARMVGYDDPGRFSRTFSKSEGISALAYRKQFQNDIK